MVRSLAAVALALALLAGCGGDDDPAPSKDEFVADANRICREGAREISGRTADLRTKLRKADSPAAQQKLVAKALEETAAEYQPFLDRLRTLDAPDALADDWKHFVDGIDEAFDLIPQLADAYREADRDKLSELTTRFTKIASDTRPFAQQNGLDDCLPDTRQG
jgi:hypothetical protein